MPRDIISPLLAFDIGNTTVSLALMDGTRVLFTARFPTDYQFNSRQYADQIRDVLIKNHISDENFKNLYCMISSVVPPVCDAIRGAVLNLTGKTPVIAGADLNTGFHILVDTPEKTGADRIILAAGALSCCQPPLILIDMGTATTIDILEPPDLYLGGMILPGTQISLDALASRTAQLPEINLYQIPENQFHPPLIGKNTIDCMLSGALYGSAAMIDGLIDRLEAERGHPFQIIAAGGVSGTIIPLCRHAIKTDADLIPRGLAVLAGLNPAAFDQS